MRVIVSLEGEAALMPWNSSKSGIDYNHKVFQALQDELIQTVKHWAAVSRALLGRWPDAVFKYESGKITTSRNTKFPVVKRIYFPPVPKSKPRFADKVNQKNKGTLSNKPWTQGLLDRPSLRRSGR